jgi:CrcB protein
MWQAVVAVCAGASAGALLRWWLSLRLNAVVAGLPLGTLIANLIGGYLVGLAIAYFATAPGLSPQWRLLIITGFCGGLTTFSTFSGEVVLLLQQGRTQWAFATMAAHLAGSVLMTFAGIATMTWLRSRTG